jgi:hypothetical protein
MCGLSNPQIRSYYILYISDLLTPKPIGCYSLRLNDQNLLMVPKTMRKTFGDRAVAKAAGP